MWPLGEPTEQGPVDLRPGTRPHAGRAEEALLVIAQDGERVELAQPADHRVGEAILEDAVAETEQRLDRAHDLEGPIEPLDVAVEVGDDAELQQSLRFAWRAASIVHRPPPGHKVFLRAGHD